MKGKAIGLGLLLALVSFRAAPGRAGPLGRPLVVAPPGCTGEPVVPRTVPVLIFHDLTKGQCFPGSCLTPVNRFLEIVEWLEESRYQTFFASDVADLMEGAPMGLRPGYEPVVLTFDDGYRDNYRLLFPIVKQHRLKVTLFLIAGKVVRRRTSGTKWALEWDEVREMVASGLVEIGSHTFDMHLDLAERHRLAPFPEDFLAEVYRDLRLSRVVLEDRLDVPVRSLAWPHGKRSPSFMRVARRAGFDRVFNTRFGLNVPGVSSLLDLRRINASSPCVRPASLARRLEAARKLTRWVPQVAGRRAASRGN